MDVAAWLKTLGLERYEQTFRDHLIDADVLPKLTVEDLRDMGIVAVGDRRRMLEAIASLSGASDAPSLDSSRSCSSILPVRPNSAASSTPRR